MPKKEYAAPAVEKGIEVVEALADRGEPMSMVEIATELNLSKHQIYRVLMSLERRGWITKEPGERFSLTNRLFDLAMRTPPQRNLLLAGLPIMGELANELNQSCHMAVVSGDDMVVVARVERPGLLGFAVREGYRLPLVQSTSGVILLAFGPDDSTLERLNGVTRRRKRAEATAFSQLINNVRKDGSISRPSPIVDGIIDLSVPINGMTDEAIAALTIPYLVGSSATASQAAARELLTNAALEITRRLRFG